MSPDVILTLNRHVLPARWVADWITGPCLKAFPTDGFSPLITENFQNTRNMSPWKLLKIDTKAMSREANSQIL